MELELKHLAPYLPYDLILYYENRKILMVASESFINIPISAVDGKDIKPILRLISNYKNGEAKDSIINNEILALNVENMSFKTILYLLKNHYDIFELIKERLAIDIKTLK